MDIGFKEFVLSTNRLYKGEKFQVLIENYNENILYLKGKNYPITLERDIIITEEKYKPFFEAYTTDKEGIKYKQEDIPNPYINFTFKTGGAVLTYNNINFVKQISKNMFIVNTEMVEFIIKKI